MAEETIRADERVRKLAAEVGQSLLVCAVSSKLTCNVGVTPENLYADGWSIGYDDRFPESVRLQQCLLFARFGDDDNIYAHPMVMCPLAWPHTYFNNFHFNRTSSPSSIPIVLKSSI